MEWLILFLLAPVIIVPIVLLFGFCGCGFTGHGRSPSAPFNLKATAISDSAISLSWEHTELDDQIPPQPLDISRLPLKNSWNAPFWRGDVEPGARPLLLRIEIHRQILSRHLDPSMLDRTGPGPCALPTQEILAGVFSAAGFTDVETESIEAHTAWWDTPTAYWDYIATFWLQALVNSTRAALVPA